MGYHPACHGKASFLQKTSDLLEYRRGVRLDHHPCYAVQLIEKQGILKDLDLTALTVHLDETG